MLNLGYFTITCVKTKHNIFYSQNEKQIGYETTLIINPLFKFTNAIIRNLQVVFWENSNNKNSIINREPLIPI
jgi:hypothetical protein